MIRGGLQRMIKLTRLSGEEFVLNADLIRFIEYGADTYITLTTSDRLVVRETADEVVRRTVEYNRAIRMFPAA
jgi:flagellar protein FlbD